MDELAKELNVLRIDCNQNKCNSDQNERQLVDTIERYAKAVLSITWDQELVITSDEFKTKNSEKVMNSIVYLLDGIRQLCDEVGDSPQTRDEERSQPLVTANDFRSVKTVLGTDISECLLWRKAGLLYAFCNCRLNGGLKLVNNCLQIEDSSELADEEVRHKLLQYLIEGMQWFRLFLSQRQPFEVTIKGTEDVLLNTSESLIANNIFSDNHLLSLMYLSEMCVWYQKYSNHWRLYLFTGFDVEECAKHCLNLYVNCVDNHFKDLGWNCEKAKQLLTLF